MPKIPRRQVLPEWQQYAKELFVDKKYSKAKITAILHDEYPNLPFNEIATCLRSISSNAPIKSRAIRTAYVCPACFGVSIRVADTHMENDFILRVRECSCGYRWRTVEIDQDMYDSIYGKGANYGYKV